MTSGSLSESCIDNPNKLESYRVGQIIGRGSKSIIYLATCIRGRLKGRKVALKVITQPTTCFEPLPPTRRLEKSLHHPSLISLYSSFTVSGSHYTVFELGEGGSLCNLLTPALPKGFKETGETVRLTEAQLRPVVRRIAEGLAYLHANGIVHGDIRPHNVFITSDGRVKLGGFGERGTVSTTHAVNEELHTRLCRKSCYAAPEIRVDGPCSFASDLWSFGCSVVVLLTGTCPFQAGEFEHLQSAASTGLYTFPAHLKISPQVEDLTYGLLRSDPWQRTPLQSVLAHPFLDSSLPSDYFTEDVIRLGNREATVGYRQPILSIISRLENGQQDSSDDVSSSAAHTMPSPVTTVRDTDRNVPTIVSRPPLSSNSSAIGPVGMKESWKRSSHLPQSEDARSSAAAEATFKQPRLVRRPFDEVENTGSTLQRSGRHEKFMMEEDGGTAKQQTPPSGLLSPPETNFGKSSHDGRATDIYPSHVWLLPALHEGGYTGERNRHSRHGVLLATERISKEERPLTIPRTNRPKRLQVAPLYPQTHKVAHGQLIVMPSLSLLVDLREGERRRGGKGDRILCIGADGREIKVFDAPHLSTPCVLSEPQETWLLDELPERYWASYKFASTFLESVKKRTPWMVWYTPQAKFVLMSNGPKGDIHASFPCSPQGRCYVTRNLTDSFTRMKIKVSRQQDTLKISRYALSNEARGKGEWISHSEIITEEQLKLGGEFMSKMTPEERQGLGVLMEGLQLAEAAEAIYMVAQPHSPQKNTNLDGVSDQSLKPDAATAKLKGGPAGTITFDEP